MSLMVRLPVALPGVTGGCGFAVLELEPQAGLVFAKSTIGYLLFSCCGHVFDCNFLRGPHTLFCSTVLSYA